MEDTVEVSGVERVKARLSTEDDRPEVVLQLSVDEGVEVGTVIRELDERVRRRAEHALGTPIRFTVELTLVSATHR